MTKLFQVLSTKCEQDIRIEIWESNNLILIDALRENEICEDDYLYFSPEEARKLAKMLNEAADKLEK